MATDKTPPRITRRPAPRQSPAQRPAVNAARATASKQPRFQRAAKAEKGPRSPIVPRIVAYLNGGYGHQSMLFNWILSATLLLIVFGCIMVLSASSIDSIKAYGNPIIISAKQFGSAVAGFVVMTIAVTRTEAFWERWSLRLYWGAIILQGLVFVPGLGVNVNGNREWIRIPGISYTIQPSEFIKLTLIISLALLLTTRQPYIEDQKAYTYTALVRAGIPIIAIMLGNDLGTSIVVLLMTFLMIWLSGVPGWQMRLPILLVSAAGIVSLFVGSSRIGRIVAWLDPSSSDTANNYAWQSEHGIWALANSHIVGQGLGMSTLKWSWIPEVENDYIFAIIGEELGIIGALATVAIFLLLGYWIIKVGQRARDSFGRLVCYGIAIWIVMQSMINIAVVLKCLPVLGVPLPLISAGGSSLVAGMAAIGVVLSIERQNHLDLDGGMRRPQKAR
jgi:cell division protein FtsW